MRMQTVFAITSFLVNFSYYDLLFWKNKARNKINPATDDTLQVISAQTSQLSFDQNSNVYINIANIAPGVDLGVLNVSNTPINPATQETLASVQSVIANFKFDTSTGSALKTTGTAPSLSDTLNVKNITTANVNPASEEAAILWRRMLKLMESKQTNDANRMKRVVVDSFGPDVVTGLGPSTATGASGSVVPIFTMSSDSTFATYTISNSLDGWGDQMFQDVARDAYARGIRNNLIFS